MVYKRYAKKNGKVYGPYYYKSYRENGVVKKVYMGQKNSEVSEVSKGPVVPRTSISYSTIFVVALVALIILAGFLIVRPTGKISLQIEPDYHLNEVLEGQISVNIEQGDSIQKDSEIKLTLSKDNDVLAEATKTFEGFLGNQINYVEVTNDTLSCENITTLTTREVCHEETVPGETREVCTDEEITDENNETIIQQVCVNETAPGETIQVCVNETIESGEENCTTTQTTDYYYQTPGEYSRNIEELISYSLDEEGDYALKLEIPSLGISSQEEFSVSAPEEAPAENVSNLTMKEPLFGIMAAPSLLSVIVNSSFGTNLTTENLTCWAKATDVDGDNVSYNGSWYKNGAFNSSFSTSNYTQGVLVNVTVLDSSLTSVGDVWSACVKALDVNGFSNEICSTNLTVLQAAVPSVSNVVLNSTLGTNLTTENLTAYYTLANADRAIFNWYKNNTPIMVLNMPFEGGSNATYTKDYSGFGNNGSAFGATWNSSRGYDGKGAYIFDGINNSIKISDSTSLNLTQGVSIESLVKGNGANFSLVNRTNTAYSKGYPQFQVVGDKMYFVWGEVDASADTQIWTAEMYTNGSGWNATKRTNTIYNKESPQLQVVGNKIYYAWHGQVNGSSYYQIWTAEIYTNGSSWNATNRTLEIPGRRESKSPQLQVVGDKIYYIWISLGTISDYQIWTSSMYTNGSGWNMTQRDDTNNVAFADPQLQVADDKIYYAWTQNNASSDRQITIAESYLNGTGWNATMITNPEIYDKREPQMQVVGDKIYYVWRQRDINNDDQIWTAKMYTNRSGWNMTQRTNTLVGNKVYPQLQVAGDKIYYMWYETDAALWTAEMYTNGSGWTERMIRNITGPQKFNQFQVVGAKKYFIGGDRDASSNYQIWTAEMGSNILNKGSGYGLGIDANSKITGFISSSIDSFKYGGESINQTAGATVESAIDSNWNHVLMTYDMLNLKLYVNGELKDTTQFTETIIPNDFAVVLGDDFNGTIDDVRIWNRSLSAQQVKTLYNNRTDLIVSQELRVNDAWQACITPNDGTQDGAMNCSNNLTVLQAPGTTPPSINFTAPTPNNFANTTNTSIEINVSITNASDLAEVKFNWNGTNYTMYNSSLVLMMNFNNVSSIGDNSTHAKDLSLYGNNGTIYGAVWNASGKYGSGLSFDGVNDYVEYAGSTSLNITNAITMEAWVKPIFEGRNMGIISKNPVSVSVLSQSYKMDVVNGTNKSYCELIFADNTWQGLGGGVLIANQWNHVVCTYDTTTKNFTSYFNGIYFASINLTGQAVKTNNASLNIGIDLYNSIAENKYFNGTIDEARIWNRSLSADEVKQQYYSNLQKLDADEWNLYVNEGGLTAQNYTYSASAKDVLGNENQTETRTIIVLQAPVLLSVSNVILNSTLGTNLTTENLTVSYNLINASKGIINWYKNNASLMLLNMPFEGGSNGTWTKDYSGFGNNGVVSGATWNATGGYDGKGAYVFDGDNDKITSNANWTNITTISMWFKSSRILNSSTGYTPLMALMQTSRDAIFLNHPNCGGNTSRLALVISPAGGQYSCVLTKTSSWNASRWYYITAMYNGTNQSIYVNGVIENSTNQTYVGGYAGPITIGGGATTSWFNGTIDDVIIFNKSLSAQQIAALYNNRTDLIVSQELRVNDTWQACITPNDGTQDGAVNCSNNLSIVQGPGPNVTLISPANGLVFEARNSVSHTQNVVCNLSDSDGNLKNVTLYADANGTWMAISSRNITGYSNLTSFNITSGPLNVTWNCLAYSTLGNSGWAPFNYTYSVVVPMVNFSDCYYAKLSYGYTGGIFGGSPTLDEYVVVGADTHGVHRDWTRVCRLNYGNLVDLGKCVQADRNYGYSDKNKRPNWVMIGHDVWGSHVDWVETCRLVGNLSINTANCTKADRNYGISDKFSQANPDFAAVGIDSHGRRVDWIEVCELIERNITVWTELQDNSSFRTNEPIIFNCSAYSAAGLANITLFITNATWQQQTMHPVSGIENSSYWELNLSSSGTYEWTCRAIDVLGSIAWGENVSILADDQNPGITFVAPTPSDRTNTTNTSIVFNISITEPNLNTMIWNWNGTNYAIYNDSLVLMYNFDNVSSLGEDSSFIADLSGWENHGYPGGGVAPSSGKFSRGYKFNSNGTIIADSSESLDLENETTISFWLNGSCAAEWTPLNVSANVDGFEFQAAGDKIYVALSKSNQLYTATMNLDGTGFNATQRTSGGTSYYPWPQMQVTDDAIYYTYIRNNGTRTHVWFAEMDLDGELFNATQLTTDNYNKYYPKLQVVEDKIYFAWTRNNGTGYELWTAERYVNGTGYNATKRKNLGNSLNPEVQMQVVDDKIYVSWASYGLSGTGNISEYLLYTNGSEISLTNYGFLFSYDNSDQCTGGGGGDIQNYSGPSSDSLDMQVSGNRVYYAWVGDSSCSTDVFMGYTNGTGLMTYGPAYGCGGGVCFGDANTEPQIQITGNQWDYAWSYYNDDFGGSYAFVSSSNQDYGAVSSVGNPRIQVVGEKTYVMWMDGTDLYVGDSRSNLVSKADAYGIGCSGGSSGYGGGGSSEIAAFVDAGVDGYKYNAEAINYSAGAKVSAVMFTYNMNWTHVTMTFNSSILKLYINGMLNGTANLSEPINTNPFDLTIGDNFNGTIDELRIWDRALRDDEVRQVYLSNLQKYDEDDWNFVVNESGLGDGTYSYFGYANDVVLYENQTETRYVTVDLTNPTFFNALNSSLTFTKRTNFTANITIRNREIDAYIFMTSANGSWINLTRDVGGMEYNASEQAVINPARGREVCWAYWANDTLGNSASSDSYCFRVQNNVSNLASVRINATTTMNLTTDDLTCWVNATDANNDNITYQGLWYKNGAKRFSDWNRTIGGSLADYGRAIATDSQDNIVITGETSSFGPVAPNVWTVKYNSSGSQIWNATIGGTGSDAGYGVAVDSQDNIIVAGNTNSFGGGGYNVWTIKYNSSGSQVWNRTWGGINADFGYGIMVDSQDNIIVAGSTSSFGAGNSDIVAIKYNSSGSQIWNKTLGEGGNDIGYGVATDNWDNVIVTGVVGTNISLAKYSSSGNRLWNKTVGSNATTYGYGVATDNQNNIIVTGRTDFATGGDVWTLKYDSLGSLLWNVTAGGNSTDSANDITIIDEDNVIVAGYTNSFGGGYNIWTIKYNSTGSQLWNKTWGGNVSDYGQGVAIDSLNNIIIGGYTNSFGAGSYDFWTIKDASEAFEFEIGNKLPDRLANLSVINNSETSTGEIWSCSVRAFDGMDYSNYIISSNLTIMPAPEPPIMTQVTINSTFGTNYSNENLFCWMNATDANGDILNYSGLWYKNGVNSFMNRTFGGSNKEFGWAIATDSQDNVIVAGYNSSAAMTSADVLVLKYYPNLTQAWNLSVGSPSGDVGYGVATDSQDNVIVAGVFNYSVVPSGEYWTIKYNSTGSQIWNRTIGGNNTDWAYDVAVDDNDNIIVTGRTMSFGAGGNDFWTVKYNSSGSQVWNATAGGNGTDYGIGVAIDSQNNVVVSGFTTSFGAGGADYWVVKYNSSGSQLWNRTAGGNSSDPTFSGVAIDSLDNIIMSGNTESLPQPNDVWTVKFDSNGNLLWNTTIGGPNPALNEEGIGISVDNSDNIIVAGYTYSYGAGDADFWTIKYYPNGTQVWNVTMGGNKSDFGKGVALDSLGNIFVAGYTNSFGAGDYDILLLKNPQMQFSLINVTSGIMAAAVIDSTETHFGENWSCEARAYDGTGFSNYSMSGNVTIDENVAPNATIISPQNATYANDSNVNFTLYVSDDESGLANATLYIYNLTGLYNQTTINLGGVLQQTVSIVVWLADGVYNWFWEVFDIAGNMFSTQTTPGNYTITADTAKPLIDFVPLTEISGSIYNRTDINVNVSVNDTNFANVTINLYNSTDLINSSISAGNIFYLNFTNLVDGRYYFNATAHDLAGNSNSTETRNVTIDTIKPIVQFVPPTENSGLVYHRTNIRVNVSVNDTNPANITIYLYNSTSLVNSSISSGNIFYLNFTNLVDGRYYFNATAYDLAGNYNSSQTRNLTIDTIAPNITIIAPENETITNETLQNFTINVSDEIELENATLYIYNETGLYNQTTVDIGGTTNLLTIIVNLIAGVYNWFWEVVDLAGNIASTQLTEGNYTITVDTVAPAYSNNATEPASPIAYAPEANYTFNITWSDLNGISNAILNFNGTDYVMDSDGSGNYNYTLGNIAAGNYSYYFWANDSAGNSNQTGIVYYLIERASPNLALSIIPSNSVASGIETNASGTGCPSQLNCTLYRDGINVSNPDVATLSAGTYLYEFNTTGNENYTSASVNETLVVSSGAPPGEGGGCSSTEWICSDWGNCTSGQQERECISNCNKKRTETKECCIDTTWTCGAWTNCMNISQAKECVSNCNTNKTETRACSCTPDWNCTEFGACSNKLMRRSCEDLNKCGTDEGKPEGQKSCKTDKCNSDYHCTGWGECTYENNANNIVAGIITYNGDKERVCFDTNDCAENLTEHMPCNSSVQIEVERKEVCNESVLSIIESIKRTPITTINLESWKTNKLDVSFIQDKVTYCASCYNGILDGNEVGIDCGGECRVCKPETKLPISFIIGLLAIVALLLIILILKFAFEDYELISRINSLIKSGEEALKNRDRKRAVDNFRKMKMLYIQIENAKNKKAILKEIQKYQRKIKGFTEF